MEFTNLKKVLAGVGMAGLVAGAGVTMQGCAAKQKTEAAAEKAKSSCGKGEKTSCGGAEKAKSSCGGAEKAKAPGDAVEEAAKKKEGGGSCGKGSCG